VNFYTFKLESFEINNTRSRHDDTDTVTFGLQVGTAQFPVQSFFAGDLNNGIYPVNLKFGSVLITDGTSIAVFTYEIYNGDASQLSTSLVALNQSLLDRVVTLVLKNTDETGLPNFSSGEAGADVPDGGDDSSFEDTSGWSGLFLEAIGADIAGFLFPDCDGFVAADGIGMTKNQWDVEINSTGAVLSRKTMHYPGSDSPAGCGSNSDYTVTWSVGREPMLGSMRKFLQNHGLRLHPGLRSLSSTAVMN
jgi:hypothetical protein